MTILQRGHIDVAQPEITDLRVLSREDLKLLAEKRPAVTLQTLRDSHHRIARAVASGISNAEVAQHCGISYNRISVLKKDPAFVELVAHYRGLVTAEYVKSVDSFMEVATANMLKAAVMLGDKLDDAIDRGEFLPTRDLMSIADSGADRFGYGKVQTNKNFNIDFAVQLESARKRSARARTIEHTPSPVAAQSAPDRSAHPVSHDRGPSPLRRL